MEILLVRGKHYFHQLVYRGSKSYIKADIIYDKANDAINIKGTGLGFPMVSFPNLREITKVNVHGNSYEVWGKINNQKINAGETLLGSPYEDIWYIGDKQAPKVFYKSKP